MSFKGFHLMPLAYRSLNDFGLLFGQMRAHEQSAITPYFALQHLLLSPHSFVHVKSYCSETSWGDWVKPSALSLRLTQLYKETGLKRLPAATHTTVLVTPRTRHSQWLGQYTDKITHHPATSPLPTLIKTGSSYLMWTAHIVQSTIMSVS